MATNQPGSNLRQALQNSTWAHPKLTGNVSPIVPRSNPIHPSTPVPAVVEPPRLVINGQPQFVDSEWLTGAAAAPVGTALNTLNLPNGLKRRNLYSYLFATTLVPGGYNALKLDVNIFNSANALIKTLNLAVIVDGGAPLIYRRSIAVMPVWGGAVIQGSIGLTLANPQAGEPASAILQAFPQDYDMSTISITVRENVNIGIIRSYFAVDSF